MVGPQFTLFQRLDIRAECVLLSGSMAGKLVSSISDSFVRSELTSTLLMLRPQSWLRTQQHVDEIAYTCRGETENGTSLAELAERVFRNDQLPCFLMNFAECRFSASTRVEIGRERDGDIPRTIPLDSIETLESLVDWAAARSYVPRPYPASSPDPPRDDQTVLVNSARFERTSRQVQGQTIYRERETGRLWYIDNLHRGLAAEIEVFDAKGMHIGVADIRGVINESKRKPGRRIDRQ
jgi:hypothetical protein